MNIIYCYRIPCHQTVHTYLIQVLIMLNMGQYETILLIHFDTHVEVRYCVLSSKIRNIAIFDLIVLQVHGIYIYIYTYTYIYIHIYIYRTYIWLPWLPDLCQLNQNEADSEFILSPSEFMSGRGVSKLWIRLLVTSGVSVTSKLWIRLLRRKSTSCCSAFAGMV